MQVESHMKAHPKGDRQDAPTVNAGQKDAKKHDGTVESPGLRMLWWTGLIEEADGRYRIQAALAQAEPHVVVGIDEHAPRHQAERAPTGPRAEQRCTRRGEH
jgi:hypothetical protein